MLNRTTTPPSLPLPHYIDIRQSVNDHLAHAYWMDDFTYRPPPSSQHARVRAIDYKGGPMTIDHAIGRYAHRHTLLARSMHQLQQCTMHIWPTYSYIKMSLVIYIPATEHEQERIQNGSFNAATSPEQPRDLQ